MSFFSNVNQSFQSKRNFLSISELWLQRRWQKLRTNFVNEKVQEKLHGVRPKSSTVEKYERHLSFMNIDLSHIKPLNDSRSADAKPEPENNEFCITQEDIDGCDDACIDRDEFEMIDNEQEERLNQEENEGLSGLSQEEIEIICTNDDDIEEINETELKEYASRTEDKQEFVNRNDEVRSGASNQNSNSVSSELLPDRQLKQTTAVMPMPSSTTVLSSPIVETARLNNETGSCEDTIFGQLVTAILKKMNPDEKKRAKKEIMNILL